VTVSLSGEAASPSSTRRVRVLLVDDHEAVREGLRLLFEAKGNVDIVRDVSDGQVALEAVRELKPDVVVMDLSMPGMNGLAAARAIMRELPDAAIVVLTRHHERAYVREVLATGARGYVLKQSSFDELLRAVNAAAAGCGYLDRTIATQVADDQMLAQLQFDPSSATSEREMAVLQLAATGRSNKEIAIALHIAVKTVEVHKANAMRKLELQDRADLIRFAALKGWLQDP
jgi:DNA-binding NarL/FixJ family response regulator